MKRPRLARSVSAAVLALVVAVTLGTTACGGSNTTSSGSPSAATSQAAASLSVAASPSATPLPTPTVAGTIAFERVEPVGHGEIFRINTSGTGLKRLAADNDCSLEAPAWSPDGTRIAYHSGDPEAGLSSYTIWLMKADGSGKVRLTKGAVHGVWPQWSPDGKQIVFTRAWPGSDRAAIFVMNADGGGLKRVTKGSAGDYYPIWAPNGTVLFLREQDVYKVNPDGSGLKRLTKGGNVGYCAVSPDGKRIAISADP